MHKYLSFLLLLLTFSLQSQSNDTLVLQFNEFLGYVKKYHPIAKQAELTIDIGQANLMKARGGFDPKIEVDYNRKEFKNSNYYDRLNATFKIPTWYGVDFKGTYLQNEGEYLNPSDIVPENGLYSAGISLSIGQGLWINDRMATLKQAKYFREQSKADRDLLINQILYEASLAYFNWLQAFSQVEMFKSFLSNADIRFKGIKRRSESGDLAAIDTVEAKITIQNRALSLEQVQVEFVKRTLELSNFLWINNNIPMELQSNVIPDKNIHGKIDTTLEILGKPLDSFDIETHPKLKSIGYKIKGLEVNKKLKANKLLPKVKLEYNFLTDTPEYINTFQTYDYKGGLSLNLPLFLRRERGDLKLAKFKLQDAQFDLDNAEIKLKNKIVSIYYELDSYETQMLLINKIVLNYKTLLAAEERKFNFGESSLFLINSRESKLIDAKLKQIALQNKFFTTKARLFNSLVVNPKSL
ncbi:transporter [Kriegella sp. EG-1]|nr:transporter [Flavobacteriaceae bacterium EG-1]